MDIQNLTSEVVKILMSDYDFEIDEAEETVENSVKDNADMWNENAEPKDLAKYLANGDDND